MKGKSSTLNLMLILSAIDMLSAALVCSIVLFVVLVGSNAAEQSDKTNMLESFSIVEIFFRGLPQQFPAISANRPLDLPDATIVSQVDKWFARFFGVPPRTAAAGPNSVYQKAVIVPPQIAELEFFAPGNGPMTAELRVSFGDGRVEIIIIRCASTSPSERPRLVLKPELAFGRVCPSNALNDIVIEAGIPVHVGYSARSVVNQSFGANPDYDRLVIVAGAENRFAKSKNDVSISRNIALVGVFE